MSPNAKARPLYAARRAGATGQESFTAPRCEVVSVSGVWQEGLHPGLRGF